MVLIAVLLFILGIVNFDRKQMYSLLPAIIDIGIILGCQDITDDALLLPRQTQDLIRGPGQA